jgi:hypothetical protein
VDIQLHLKWEKIKGRLFSHLNERKRKWQRLASHQRTGLFYQKGLGGKRGTHASKEKETYRKSPTVSDQLNRIEQSA